MGVPGSRPASIPALHSALPGHGVPRTLRSSDAVALRASATRFGGVAEAAKTDALARIAGMPLVPGRALVEYHDTLLFLLAYPGSHAVHRLAGRELARVARRALDAAGEGRPRERRRLDGTGIAGGAVTASFSHSIARWLARAHRSEAEIDEFGDATRVPEVLALCLPRIESEILATADGAVALLDALKGPDETRLRALLAMLARLRVPEVVRSHLFESLQPFIALQPRRSRLSRTFARVRCRSPFLQVGPLERHLDQPAATMSGREPTPVPLAAADQRALLAVARASLAMLARETDPLTWPSVRGISLYELGRGATVALFPMEPSRRFALDTHTGYLMLKNGVPVGYGGGWPFLATCRTGTNIFSPFRGGESAWLFARVLAVYRRHFAVKRFVVEPYQFGAGNREGRASGAFWFYYRLGFRPVDSRVAGLARTEFARLSRGGYRPPSSTMRRLTEFDLALDLAPTSPVERTEAADIALAVSRWIASEHRGDAAAANRAAVSRVTYALGVAGWRGWPRGEREAFASLALAFAMIPDVAQWSSEDKSAAVDVMRAKGRADDAPYFRMLCGHRRLPAALSKIAARCR